MGIESYSLAKDGEKKLSANFKVREFACKDGSNTIFVCEELVQLLQNIRDHFNRPVTITSAYRTMTHNKKVGGSPKSQHLYGMAADFWVEGVDVATVAAYAEALLPTHGGVGRYPKDAKHPNRKTGWVHVDTRANKSRWTL